MFENFPYTNFHNLNLDWIVKTVKLLFNKAVFSINNIEPDDDGNVTITGAELGAIGTVNNIAPVDGNVTLTASDVGAIATGQGVTKVNGFGPDSSGNVLSGTVRSINGISPASLPTPGNVVLNAFDVGALSATIDPVETVNGISPDANGNVNVGTVKSVNGSAPDAQGNVNLPTVAGVTSVDGVGPNAQGNVQLNIMGNINIYVAPTGNDSNDGTQNNPFLTIQHAIDYANSTSKAKTPFTYIINIAPGTYNECVNINRAYNIITLSLQGNVNLCGIRVNCADLYINCNGYKLTLTYNSALNYPNFKNSLFYIGYSSLVYVNKSNIEIVNTSNTFKGLYIETTKTEIYAEKITFSGTFQYCMQLTDGATAKIRNIVAPSTNIGKIENCAILVCATVNNSNNYTGTGVDTGGRIFID